MAQAISKDVETEFAQHEALRDWYWEWLNEPAEEHGYRWEPVLIGPTWQVEDGRFVLPPRDRTIGLDVLAWCGTNLQHGPDDPWRFTKEQARFILHWYSIDETGRFVFHDAVLQRLKGWGKDPLAACLMLVEMLGPCRFGGWDEAGEPLALDVRDAWVQTAAVSLEQTKNTMRLLPALVTPAAKRRYGLQIGKEKVYALRDERLLEAVTSSPATLQGARSTFVLMNETHEWVKGNDGHEMSAVITDNATKMGDGAARTLHITNAYEPGEDSVAERDREAFEKMTAEETLFEGLLYDSIEASEHAPLSPDAAPEVVRSIRGDSTWLDETRIVKRILDPRNPPSRSRRFWYNQITASEDAWTTPQQWDASRNQELKLADGDQITLFFDGSKSDDTTGLVGCRIEDGAVFVLGVWARPDGAKEWSVPRDIVDDKVASVFATYDVVGFFADPGAGEDESGERYWDAMIDRWNLEYGEKLCVWSVQSGADRHAILWDMRSPTRVKLFTEACERALGDLESGMFLHDGNLQLRIHATNARRRPNQYGISIGKEHRESKRKIDLIVCAIAARMLQRIYLALPENRKRQSHEVQIWV